jgi:ABC-type amino acid transport substrate-binding protein
VGAEDGIAVRGLSSHQATLFPSTGAILEAVASGKVRAGYVISTRGSWLARKDWQDKLSVILTTKPTDFFPVSAAVRKADGDLKDAIDQAFADLDRSGRLERVFARWYIPYERGNTTAARSEPGQ